MAAASTRTSWAPRAGWIRLASASRDRRRRRVPEVCGPQPRSQGPARHRSRVRRRGPAPSRRGRQSKAVSVAERPSSEVMARPAMPGAMQKSRAELGAAVLEQVLIASLAPHQASHRRQALAPGVKAVAVALAGLRADSVDPPAKLAAGAGERRSSPTRSISRTDQGKPSAPDDGRLRHMPGAGVTSLRHLFPAGDAYTRYPPSAPRQEPSWPREYVQPEACSVETRNLKRLGHRDVLSAHRGQDPNIVKLFDRLEPAQRQSFKQFLKLSARERRISLATKPGEMLP